MDNRSNEKEGNNEKDVNTNTMHLDKEVEYNYNNAPTREFEFNNKDISLTPQSGEHEHIQNPKPEESSDKIEQPQVNKIEVQATNFDSLDESISDTIKRDLKAIFNKLKYVLLPRFSAQRGEELRNWDLWGPLLICLILCLTIAFSQDSDFETKGNTFIIIFVIVWIGGLFISLNSHFLGAKMNIFQGICLLGYCIFPIDIAAIFIRVVSTARLIKLIIVGAAFIWSCFSSVGFISGMVIAEKKMVAVYPVFLFFLILSWFVLTL